MTTCPNRQIATAYLPRVSAHSARTAPDTISLKKAETAPWEVLSSAPQLLTELVRSPQVIEFQAAKHGRCDGGHREEPRQQHILASAQGRIGGAPGVNRREYERDDGDQFQGNSREAKSVGAKDPREGQQGEGPPEPLGGGRVLLGHGPCRTTRRPGARATVPAQAGAGSEFALSGSEQNPDQGGEVQ